MTVLSPSYRWSNDYIRNAKKIAIDRVLLSLLNSVNMDGNPVLICLFNSVDQR